MAKEEKDDGRAELPVMLAGPCRVGRLSWQMGQGQGWAGSVGTAGPCPAEWLWLLSHNCPTPQPMPEPGHRSTALSTRAAHAPSCFL